MTDLGISLCHVDAVEVDFTINLILDSGAQLRIETDCELSASAGRLVKIEIGDMRALGGETELLRDRTIDSALADSQTGELVIRFTDGTMLRVPSDPEYEAWALSQSDGSLTVALPGGGISTWDARR